MNSYGLSFEKGQPPYFGSIWNLDDAGGTVLHRFEHTDIVPHRDVGVLVKLACPLGHGTDTHQRRHHQITEGVDMPRRQVSGETGAARVHQTLHKVFQLNPATFEN